MTASSYEPSGDAEVVLDATDLAPEAVAPEISSPSSGAGTLADQVPPRLADREDERVSEALRRVVLQRIARTHGLILEATEGLTADELARRFTPTATPIGWHLWHMSRWADRLHASFPNRPFVPGDRWDPRRQLWGQEGLASRWGLDPKSLGILESGSGMDQDAAAVVARAGKELLIDYARRAFGGVDALVASLQSADLELSRNSIMEFVDNPAGQGAAEASGAATTVAEDLAFHFSHASRHLGMIEALRGMLGRNGTATT